MPQWPMSSTLLFYLTPRFIQAAKKKEKSAKDKDKKEKAAAKKAADTPATGKKAAAKKVKLKL